MNRSALVLLAAVGLALPGAAVAVGSDDGRATPPAIEKVVGLVDAKLAPASQVECTGADGARYLEVATVVEGTINSDEPRIGTGKRFWGRIRSLINTSSGEGLGSDDFQISDPGTGRLIVEGTTRATLQRASGIKGLAIGRFADNGDHFIAVGSWILVPLGLVMRQAESPNVHTYGSDVPANGSDAAFVVRGACSADFDRHFWGKWTP
jgi:hypothetical protein